MAQVALHFNGATTEMVRDLASVLSRNGHEGELRLGLDGPELWHGETPELGTRQFAHVVAELVKISPSFYGGASTEDGKTSIADALDEWRTMKRQANERALADKLGPGEDTISHG